MVPVPPKAPIRQGDPAWMSVLKMVGALTGFGPCGCSPAQPLDLSSPLDLTIMTTGATDPDTFQPADVQAKLQEIVNQIPSDSSRSIEVHIVRGGKPVPDNEVKTQLGLLPKGMKAPTQWKQELYWTQRPTLGDFSTKGPRTTGQRDNIDSHLRSARLSRQELANKYANSLAHEVLYIGLLGQYDRPWSTEPFENGWEIIPSSRLITIPDGYRGNLRKALGLE